MIDIEKTKRKFNIIYADPPWEEKDNYSGQSCELKKPKRFGLAYQHYRTMKNEDVMALPVSKITDENCALFLWCTSRHLPVAFKVIEAWGFRYINMGFVWVKTCKRKSNNDGFIMSLGYYTRSNAEFCLFAIKGSLKPVSHRVRSIIAEPRTEHSRKPQSTRDRITSLFGELPRIELFARQRIEGWEAWGNQV